VRGGAAAAAAVNLAARADGRFATGDVRFERRWRDSGLGFRVVCCHGLLDVEGLAVRVRFDPDRRTYLPALATVSRRGRQLLLEVLNPLESGFRHGHASDGGVVLHRISLLAADGRRCSIGHGARLPARSTASVHL
jgi:hypothetical protein